MDPAQSPIQTGPDSPMESPELVQAPVETGAAFQQSEQAAKAMELPTTSQAVQVATAQVAAASVPPLPPPVEEPSTVGIVPLSADSPEVADDNDLIEQEWVDKAKAIVDRTREDPHLQNKEINRFKADYIKKRYKREIKVNEA